MNSPRPARQALVDADKMLVGLYEQCAGMQAAIAMIREQVAIALMEDKSHGRKTAAGNQG